MTTIEDVDSRVDNIESDLDDAIDAISDLEDGIQKSRTPHWKVRSIHARVHEGSYSLLSLYIISKRGARKVEIWEEKSKF
jgi:hypothetical protein